MLQLKDGGSVQTINQRRDRSLIVRIGEQNQLFVDEVIVGEVPGMSSIEVLLGGEEDEGEKRAITHRCFLHFKSNIAELAGVRVKSVRGARK